MNNDYIYNNIKEVLLDYEDNKANKTAKRNILDLTAYYKVGKLLCDATLIHGDDILLEYSESLKEDVNNKYSEVNLKRYKAFYLLIENGGRLSFDLKWSHYVEIIHSSVSKANYYIYLIEHNDLSIRELRYRLKTNEYEKLIKSTISDLNKGIKISNDTSLKDFVKNPVIIRNSLKYETITEDELQNLMLDDIKVFSSKLNTTFSFIGIEYKVKFDECESSIDLLLYSIKFNCYIVVELKNGSCGSDHIGQLEAYMNYVDENIKLRDENNTIGVIVLRKDNVDSIAYCTDNRVLIREDNIIK